jgi:cystatin-A/B
MPLPGGHSEASTEITPEIQKIADDIKPVLEEKVGRSTFSEYTLVEYRQQVVAGMIYHFKIQVSPSECVHAKVFRPLPHEQKGLQVKAWALQTLEDPLETLPDTERE